MGTITIVEYAAVGGQGAVDGSPVRNLSTALKTTVDATTSATPESVTLQDATRYVTVSAAELHRVSVKDNTVADRYETVTSSTHADFAINQGDRTLYYRTDAS